MQSEVIWPVWGIFLWPAVPPVHSQGAAEQPKSCSPPDTHLHSLTAPNCSISHLPTAPAWACSAAEAVTKLQNLCISQRGLALQSVLSRIHSFPILSHIITRFNTHTVGFCYMKYLTPQFKSSQGNHKCTKKFVGGFQSVRYRKLKLESILL